MIIGKLDLVMLLEHHIQLIIGKLGHLKNKKSQHLLLYTIERILFIIFFRFWEPGQVTSEGMNSIARIGTTSTLESELKSKVILNYKV